MPLNLSPEQEKRINNLVANGTLRAPEDFVESALELFEQEPFLSVAGSYYGQELSSSERQRLATEAQEHIRVAIDQANRGELITQEEWEKEMQERRSRWSTQ